MPERPALHHNDEQPSFGQQRGFEGLLMLVILRFGQEHSDHLQQVVQDDREQRVASSHQGKPFITNLRLHAASNEQEDAHKYSTTHQEDAVCPHNPGSISAPVEMNLRQPPVDPAQRHVPVEVGAHKGDRAGPVAAPLRGQTLLLPPPRLQHALAPHDRNKTYEQRPKRPVALQGVFVDGAKFAQVCYPLLLLLPGPIDAVDDQRGGQQHSQRKAVAKQML
mmetsp:Transcript_13157/g.36734  ORF Transcript_13157/g.36734 Transcript_13157/m.36734 type:complete len:221 (+) Transcript_13157:373-1035(+)